jgi:hypothetical protein
MENEYAAFVVFENLCDFQEKLLTIFKVSRES